MDEFKQIRRQKHTRMAIAFAVCTYATLCIATAMAQLVNT